MLNIPTHFSMNKVQSALFCLFVIAFSFAGPDVHSQSINSFNLSYTYNPSGPIQFKYRLVKSDPGYKVYFQLNLPAYDTIGNYELNTFYRSSYSDSSAFNETTHNWADLTDVSAYPQLAGKLAFMPSESQNIIVFHVKRPSTQKSFFFDVALEGDNMFTPDGITPVDNNGMPVLKSFFSPRDSLSLTAEDTAQLYGFYYNMDFEEARPPMVIDTISGGKTMGIDSSFMMRVGYFSATKPGLYLFQTDSSSGSALAMRLAPFYYPKFVSVDEIIGTLRYISSKEEYNKLVSSKTRKKALDNFLLDISGSQDRAKRIMQNYFTRVAEANLLFTGFKEGWKTDAGMIYIIFGHPDVVERNDVGEVWTYLKMEDKSDLKFEFMRVKNIFTPGYLTLIRKDDYDRYWFRFVDLWRKGRI